ncbi:MAG: hypothetical protein COT73_03290 [Bdellovibrio sp. CG10_big_fil_rev_8_21_14_0_10_47_8]|nr:MAG: hypothetical protein COT73_03290 [Bdellovibrio sp. CG10_big_fil_rev_8_21_14_0_10_47_8]
MKEVFLYFLRLGFVGVGGPLALVAQMQQELVVDRKWMREDEFRSTFGLIKAMPGPVAFQTAVFLAHHRRGFWGALVAGLCIIAPSFVFMVLLAMFYTQYTDIPWVHSLMKGMQIGALALILGALKTLAQGFLRHWLFWLLMGAGIILCLFTSVPEPALIILFAVLSLSLFYVRQTRLHSLDPVLMTLFLVCIKAGAFVFGTGLAIVPFLENDFVNRLQWLSHPQFMDALAFGQLTPGPVVITVTFIGYKIAGFLGAVIATGAIFLPAFFHMVTWFPRMVGWLLRQSWIMAFSMGVTAAVCATILVSVVRISQDWTWASISDVLILFLASFKVKIPSWLLIFLAGLGGVILGAT